MDSTPLFTQRVSRRVALKTGASVVAAANNPQAAMQAMATTGAPLSAAASVAPTLTELIIDVIQAQYPLSAKAWELLRELGGKNPASLNYGLMHQDPDCPEQLAALVQRGQAFIASQLDELRLAIAQKPAEDALFSSPKLLAALWEHSEGGTYNWHHGELAIPAYRLSPVRDQNEPAIIDYCIGKRIDTQKGSCDYQLRLHYNPTALGGTVQDSGSSGLDGQCLRDTLMNSRGLIAHADGIRGLFNAASQLPPALRHPLLELLTAPDNAAPSAAAHDLFGKWGGEDRTMGQLRHYIQSGESGQICRKLSALEEKLGMRDNKPPEHADREKALAAWQRATHLSWELNSDGTHYEATIPATRHKRLLSGLELPVYDRAQGVLTSINRQAAQAGEDFDLRAESVGNNGAQTLRIPAKLFHDLTYAQGVEADLHNKKFMHDNEEMRYWQQVESCLRERAALAALPIRDRQHFHRRADYIAAGRPVSPAIKNR